MRAVRAQVSPQREGCVRFLEVLAVYRAWETLIVQRGGTRLSRSGFFSLFSILLIY